MPDGIFRLTAPRLPNKYWEAFVVGEDFRMDEERRLSGSLLNTFGWNVTIITDAPGAKEELIERMKKIKQDCPDQLFFVFRTHGQTSNITPVGESSRFIEKSPGTNGFWRGATSSDNFDEFYHFTGRELIELVYTNPGSIQKSCQNTKIGFYIDSCYSGAFIQDIQKYQVQRTNQCVITSHHDRDVTKTVRFTRPDLVLNPNDPNYDPADPGLPTQEYDQRWYGGLYETLKYISKIPSPMTQTFAKENFSVLEEGRPVTADLFFLIYSLVKMRHITLPQMMGAVSEVEKYEDVTGPDEIITRFTKRKLFYEEGPHLEYFLELFRKYLSVDAIESVEQYSRSQSNKEKLKRIYNFLLNNDIFYDRTLSRFRGNPPSISTAQSYLGLHPKNWRVNRHSFMTA